MKSRTLTCVTATIVLVALAVPIQVTAQHTRYTVIDLGTLGGTFSIAQGMNNKGWVSGFSFLPGDTQGHAFLWKKGVMTDLGTLGGPFSSATDRISESGEISGFSSTNIPDTIEGGVKGLAFLWRKGVMTPLPSFNNAGGAEVNNRGQVVGTAEISALDPSCVPPRILQSKPVIWYRGTIQLLPTFPGDPNGLSLGINDEGVAVGSSGSCTEPHFHALLWQDGTVTDLGNFGGTINNEAVGVNNQRQVVGRSGLPGDATFHAFLWENGAMTDLGTLAGDFLSFALNINSKGQAVGFSCDTDENCRGVLWQNGVMTDLNTLIPAGSDWFLLEADDVNDRGQIAGLALQISTGEGHAFLATPINGEVASETVTDSRGETRPNVVLPENVRKMLRERLGFGRFLGTPQKLALSGAAAISGPNATLSPTSLTFSTQAIGTTSTAKTVTLKNTGTAILTISSIAITGINAGDFAQTHTCGSLLAAGASCKISVKFKPTMSGTRTAALSIRDNASGSPQKVTLSGIGTAAKLSPISLSFGSIGLGTTSLPKTVILKNVGTTTLTITGIAITGTNAGDFAQTHTCGSSLAAGATCSISVRFTPAVLGTRTAALSITDNAAGSPQKVALSGVGVNGGTLTGYCVHGQFVPLLGCRITSDPTQCPPGALAINPVVVSCGSPGQGPFYVDDARSCRVLINGQFFGGTCQRTSP